jgi:hypothetical protein
MLSKTLLSFATAALIAASSLGLTTTTASAKIKGHVFIGIGGGNQYVCHKEWRTVVWYDKWGIPHYKNKLVTICSWQPIYFGF